ncbi:small nuclear ribonucleoprotein 35kDa (U11/U12) [Columba livia]|uniref:U11/U12 small nuclear ribonucleoprotein 35 kDa protein n=1 Tax=Columba livia TaxID=8932 RepID=A0A2I0M8J0_COLLI|nr:small nuclear ribonucleoprotein 35kDa (U11/U12) [Columba livia]
MNDWAPIAKEYDPLKAGSIDGTDEEPHDRAIWRAMLARYVPNKGVTGDPHLTLFVARLNLQTTEEKLKEAFSRYGDIRKIRLVRDLVTGFSKGYAFIEYKEERALLKAHRDANRLVIDQHEIFVDFELERTLKGWIPRRLGGGFGGKKESGQLRFGGRDRPFRKPINLPNMKNDFYGEGSAEKRNWSREGTRDWRTRDRDHERSRDNRRPERERSWAWGESERERDSKEERSRGRERKDRDRKDRDRDRSDKHRAAPEKRLDAEQVESLGKVPAAAHSSHTEPHVQSHLRPRHNQLPLTSGTALQRRPSYMAEFTEWPQHLPR